jgi:hypothetical protein
MNVLSINWKFRLSFICKEIYKTNWCCILVLIIILKYIIVDQHDPHPHSENQSAEQMTAGASQDEDTDMGFQPSQWMLVMQKYILKIY